MDGNWMRTYTGARVHIASPGPDEIRIKDIAHALAHLCRFCGHVPEFYSVAQHSVLVADVIEDLGSPEHMLCGLMHDAAEAYLHDLHRPLKRCLSEYGELEERMMAAVCLKFDLPSSMPAIVKRADNMALATEFRDLYAEPLDNCIAWAGEAPSPSTIEPVSPEAAERMFLDRFRKLSRRAA